MSISAQSLRAYEQAGDEAFQKADYNTSLYYYQEVLKNGFPLLINGLYIQKSNIISSEHKK